MRSEQTKPLRRFSRLPLPVLLLAASALVFLSNAWAENRNGAEFQQANPYDLMDASQQANPYDLMDASQQANPYDLMDATRRANPYDLMDADK